MTTLSVCENFDTDNHEDISVVHVLFEKILALIRCHSQSAHAREWRMGLPEIVQRKRSNGGSGQKVCALSKNLLLILLLMLHLARPDKTIFTWYGLS